jgi:hypothetical protein
LGRLPDPVFGSREVPSPPPPLAPPRSARPAPTGGSAPDGWIPPGGISRRWRYIVIHHSATPTGCASEFDRAHRGRGWDELGYHFVIGNGSDTADGQIEVGSRWLRQKHGAHCKTPDQTYNQHGIGICLVGNFEQTRPTGPQMDSLVRLLRFLTAECGIPVGRIVTHQGVTGRTLCPGRHFTLGETRRRLAAASARMAVDGP